MSRSALTVQEVVETGLEATYVAANVDGNSIANPRGDTFLHVKNGDASSMTVTIQTPLVVEGLAVADPVTTVEASEDRFIGPFPADVYNQAGGLVYVDYSAVTSVTVAALQLPR